VKKSEKAMLTKQELEAYGATSSGGAGAGTVEWCGSDSSCFELMFNIKNMFQNGTKSSAVASFLRGSPLRLQVKILMWLWRLHFKSFKSTTMLNMDRFWKNGTNCSIHFDNNCSHGNPLVKNVRALMITFLLLKKVGLLYGRVEAGAAS
jgi:hypothetical protein